MPDKQEKPNTPLQREVDNILQKESDAHAQREIDAAVREMGLQPVSDAPSTPPTTKADESKSQGKDIDYSQGLGM